MNPTAGLSLGERNSSISSDQCFVLPDPSFNTVMDRHTTNLVTAIINGLCSPFAVVANFLVVFVIARNGGLHSPSNLLLASLASSDFLVGLLVQPCYIVFRLQENILHFVPCLFRVIYSESFWVCYGVSFLTLSAISFERYIALRLHLRYKELVTTQRVLKLVVSLWVLEITLTSLEWIWKSGHLRKIHAFLLLICLLATFGTHIKIFWILRRHQRQINSFSHMPPKRNLQRQTRLAVNVSYIVVIYITCNIPVLLIMAYLFAGGHLGNFNICSWTETIAFLNSSINPVICCWRNRGIRKAVSAKIVCLNKTLTKMELGNTSVATKGNKMRLSAYVIQRKWRWRTQLKSWEILRVLLGVITTWNV